MCWCGGGRGFVSEKREREMKRKREKEIRKNIKKYLNEVAKKIEPLMLGVL